MLARKKARGVASAFGSHPAENIKTQCRRG